LAPDPLPEPDALLDPLLDPLPLFAPDPLPDPVPLFVPPVGPDPPFAPTPPCETGLPIVRVRVAVACVVGEAPHPMVAIRRERPASVRNKVEPESADFTPPIRK